MTPARQSTVIRDPAGTDSAARTAPVIILTYPLAGADQLAALLAADPDLACTTGTGILPLCQQAAAAWATVDGHPDSPPSRLAQTTIRALLTSMITALLVRHGKRRWCEIATAAPQAAGTFARLFPDTRVVCLHRAFPAVARAALDTSPWGLAGPEYAPFISAHPASTTAALTAYWATHTDALLAFEQAHPGICHRLRYEDLTDGSLTGLPDFLRLREPVPVPVPAAWPQNGTADAAPDTAGPDTGFPAAQVPPALLDRANSLMRQLGYRPMAP